MHAIQQKILDLAKNQDLGKLSLREIGALVGEKNYPQKIKHHLEQLKQKGLIQIDKKTKSVKTASFGFNKTDLLYSIPILGSANCGEAVNFAEEQTEGYLKVSKNLFSAPKNKKVFALKAVGHSMNCATVGEDKKAIEDGDYVIIESDCHHPKNGEYVVSIIDGCANIKKFIDDKKENNQIVLSSESTLNYPPIYIHAEDQTNYLINGKVVQVIKKPKNM